MTRDIKGLLFDKDGTLFDFGDTWRAWAHAFLNRIAKGDRARAAQLGSAVGFDVSRGQFAPDSIVIAGTPGEVAAVLSPHLPELTLNALTDIINDEAARAPQTETTPLLPFLRDLRQRGLALGVATNDAEMPARTHLEASGVVQSFDFIAGSDSGFGGKPAPGQLLAFADHVGLAPQQIAMIGDSTHDLIAAEAAGMMRIAVLTGLASERDLAPFADLVLPDISHLPAWLDRQTQLTPS